MGSLENGQPLKRDPLLVRSFASRGSKTRSRISRFILFWKLDYLQWLCAVAVFSFFLILFQTRLPGSTVDKSRASSRNEITSRDFEFLKEISGFDFGEDIRFEPIKILERFQKEATDMNVSSSNSSRRGVRIGNRKPQLALVFADLSVDPHQVLMVTLADSLREIGYAIQVYSMEDGPVHDVWRNMGVPVTLIQSAHNEEIFVDWLNYDGILVNSLEVRGIIFRFMQEPFKTLPLIWTIHEKTLAARLRKYTSDGQIELINDWKKTFNRATVVVFPNYVLPMIYSTLDSGNYFVISGSPAEALEINDFKDVRTDNLRLGMGYRNNDFIIAIVGSQFLYRGLWLEHALVLKALLPLFSEFPVDKDSNSRLKIIILSEDSTSNYTVAVEAIAHNLNYPKGVVRHNAVDGDANGILSISDIVIYGSFLEEKSFPASLIKAMGFGKPIIAPNLSMIKKYVDDRVNGYLFPKDNIRILTLIASKIIANGKLSPLAHNIASIGKNTAKTMMVPETIDGYGFLLENVLKLPSEVGPIKGITEISPKVKEEWQWHRFEAIAESTYSNSNLKSSIFLDNIEEQWNQTKTQNLGALPVEDETTFLYSIWMEEKSIRIASAKKRREEEELKDRTDQTRGTWEVVYRNAKRADRTKNDLHERDEGELERTGQPLCIYEPYFGEGTWPFLHHTSLYRGIGLSSKGRRPGVDDVDAPSRLPLLSNPYYRDALSEVGAFFAIANRIDRIHKNAWIGFQSWRATARKGSLSKVAQNALLDAIQKRRYGDTLYFWVRMDADPRNPLQLDFWSFCDSINAGNCRFAFSEALKKMYGIKHDWDSLPPMTVDGDTWSVMHTWVLPTRSFLEFVMFSRMFVDALDAQMYDEHHQSGRCYLSLSKDKNCYSRLLEVLVNVWAYHSARRMVYINPESGVMHEQHRLKGRKGQMWIRWFSYATLKSMDEDMAEESDLDHLSRRWLWPTTGEVYYQGVYQREKNLSHRQKEKRRQQSKDKISRIRRRTRQKAIGKYIKPPPEVEVEVEEVVSSNSTTVIG